MARINDTPIRKQSRAEIIQELIRERIARGVWKPGDKIDDRVLTEELSVSRLSVREALSRLVATGVVVLESWKGYRLRELDRHEIDSIIDVRLSLEELAIRSARKNATDATFAQLEQTVSRSIEFRDKGDTVAFRREDTHFHEIIYYTSNNRWIEEILGNLRPLIDAIWFISQDNAFESVTNQSVEEHFAILEALRSGNEASAVEAMRTHMVNHRTRVHEHYRNVTKEGKTDGT